jgi:response regulator RpfG family c-di-GMP phosphodiesterase
MTTTEPDVLEPLPLARRHKVVLVDDDPAVLSSLGRLLRREPYELRSTAHPDLALTWIEEGDVSLVVTDQRMPDLCGTDLAERVRRVSPETIRVLLTAYPGNAVVRHGLAEDVQWLISKPWNDDALRLTLRQLLREREARAVARSAPRSSSRASWLSGNAAGRIARAAARGVGWGIGFFGATDAGGMLPH